MVKALSTDLRERMARGMAEGKSRRSVAAQFEVAPSTAVRLQQLIEETGSTEPRQQGRPKGGGKLEPVRDAIIAKVEAEPSITMPALSVWLIEAHGVTAHPANLSKLLCAAGFTYKKNTSGLGERAR